MRDKELRAELRIEVSRRGAVSNGDERFACMVMDMSDSGMLLMSTRDFDVGQTLDFKCELFPDQPLQCKIQVMHVGTGGVGAKIIEIDDQGKKLIQLFLQEEFSSKLRRWT
jgi:hypothetical protein